MSISRRLFLKRVAFGGGALTLASSVLASTVAAQGEALAHSATPFLAGSLTETASTPVVAFFDGQLWLDPSGTSEAYRAPRGMRSAEALSTLTQSELHSFYGRL
jgi:hypothetical protein